MEKRIFRSYVPIYKRKLERITEKFSFQFEDFSIKQEKHVRRENFFLLRFIYLKIRIFQQQQKIYLVVK